MKNILKILLIFAISPVILLSSDDIYMKINRGFDIYGRVFRELNHLYVNELDPEELIENSIDGMLKDLDPYTTYINKEDAEVFESATYGYFTGIGIYIKDIDNKKVVKSILDESPAKKAGIEIGDEIIKINDTFIENASESELQKLLKGEKGTSLKIRFKKFYSNDEIEKEIVREIIQIPDVSHYQFLNDSIVYIKLSSFSIKSAQNFKQSLTELRNEKEFNDIIIDLRDNPGGVLKSAIDILDLFFPKNTLVLSAKSKREKDDVEYLTKSDAYFKNLKIVILINNNSASASEVVAGAIQDYDIGVIVGRKSFGKGLIQSVVELPNGAALRITTAKYYTPSGRCIQKINYKLKENTYDESVGLIFKTRNGRRVNKEDGISPDRIISKYVITEVTNDLVNKDLLFSFVSTIYDTLKKVKNIDSTYADFVIDKLKLYLSKNNKIYDTGLLKTLNRLENKKYSEIISDETINNIIILENSIKNDLFRSIDINKNEIFDFVEYEVFRRKLSDNDFFNYYLKKDRYTKEAIKILEKEYYKILNPE